MLPREEREHFLADIGLKEPGLDRLIRAGYALLPPSHSPLRVRVRAI